MSGAEFLRGGRGGFTLIEILVVMTLLGLMAVALFGGLRFGARVWESGDQRSAAFAEVEIAHSLIRRLLEQAMPLEYVDGSSSFATFIGDEESIQFTAPAPAQFNLGGIYLFELGLEPGEEHEKLVLRWRLYRSESLDESFEDEESEGEEKATHGQRTLLQNLEAVRFNYFGSPEADEDDLDWRDTWDEAVGLPRLVSVELTLPREDSRHWPLLQVAPQAGSAMIYKTTP
jgi:general secretion pathway protein J